MIIFPAIDLKEGLCVRLMQGDPERVTVYGKDPVAMARHWEGQGAPWLHVVDLDGAFSQTPKNREVVIAIARAVSIPVQVGGGIRTLAVIEDYLGSGLERVILGTAALREPQLRIDARDGQVAIEGWQETTGTDVISLVERFAHLPLAAVIYTDIARDGMQSGVNVPATRSLLEATQIPVIASGGVATLKDLEILLPLVPLGLLGVITGRAIYSGTLVLAEALALVQKHPAAPGLPAP